MSLSELSWSKSPLLVAVGSESRNFGYLLTCDRCKDSSGLISAFLVIPAGCACWALCGPCLQQMPKSLGRVVQKTAFRFRRGSSRKPSVVEEGNQRAWFGWQCCLVPRHVESERCLLSARRLPSNCVFRGTVRESDLVEPRNLNPYRLDFRQRQMTR